jgi:polysaccharide biosynthesis/export protein
MGMRVTFMFMALVFVCHTAAQVAAKPDQGRVQVGLFPSYQEDEPAAKSGAADGNWHPALTGERRPLYRLCKSDVVEIGFTFAPEFNQTATLQPDGFIALKGIEDLYAEGMTVPQLREAIAKAYAASLHEPEVTVVLRDFNKPYFIAGGEVAHPGKYELRSDTTVVEAVETAGGFTGQSKHSQVVLFRRVSQETFEAKLLNVKKMLNAHNLGEDMHLQPGDLLYVPQNSISKIRQYLPVSDVGAQWNHGIY